jgi:hypothetical protein
MTATIKAIETHFDGYHFRSRLEARWACFFNALGVRYEYEKDGFHLPSGEYLPDFWLPELELWWEIKGELAKPKEVSLVRELADATGHAAVLWLGLPADTNSHFGRAWCASGKKKCDHACCIVEWEEHGVGLALQSFSSKDVQNRGMTKSLPHVRFLNDDFSHFSLYSTMRIQEAAAAAKAARFEHGETPAPQHVPPPKYGPLPAFKNEQEERDHLQELIARKRAEQGIKI